MKTALKSRLLLLLSLPCLSRIWGRIAGISRPCWLVRFMIRVFALVYRISMEDFQGDFSDYKTLGKFFTRPLDPLLRPLSCDPGFFLSPSDGILSHVQEIDSDRALQVKGKTYSLSALTGESRDWSKGWLLAVVYLSPSNYHRFHYPLDARLSFLRYMGGRLFPVNSMGLSLVDNLFIENERVAACFETNGHSWYMVAVGAALVGGIHMNLHPDRPEPDKNIPVSSPVRQTHEMGHFAMGSTLIMLVPRSLASSSFLVPSGEKVRVGTRLLEVKN